MGALVVLVEEPVVESRVQRRECQGWRRCRCADRGVARQIAEQELLDRYVYADDPVATLHAVVWARAGGGSHETGLAGPVGSGRDAGRALSMV